MPPRKKVEYKKCVRCQLEKPVSDFYKRRSAVDGLQAACKACSDETVRRSIAKPKPAEVEGQKRCATCKALKPLEQFHKNKRRFDGRHHVCKECAAPAQKAWGKNNRQRLNEWRRAYYAANPSKKPHADRRARRKFSLPRNWSYEATLAAQGGGCAICGRPDDPGRRQRLSIDHCHATNRLRGILCTWCNQGLGQFRDRPELLRKAASYLENPPGPQI